MMTGIGTSLKKILTLLVMSSVLVMGVSTPGFADVISTEDLASVSDIESKRSAIKSFLARDAVKSKLSAWGVGEQDVRQRVDALTDQEVQEMIENMDAMPAGEGILETVIAILVILLLLDIAGVTDIFPSV